MEDKYFGIYTRETPWYCCIMGMFAATELDNTRHSRYSFCSLILSSSASQTCPKEFVIPQKGKGKFIFQDQMKESPEDRDSEP